MNEENRRHPREKMIADVYYKDEKKQLYGGCVAKNVSESGVCINIEEFIPVGTVLDLQFKLPLSPIAFYVKAKVVRINKIPYSEQWEAGLEMVMDVNYERLVRQYIAMQKLS